MLITKKIIKAKREHKISNYLEKRRIKLVNKDDLQVKSTFKMTNK